MKLIIAIVKDSDALKVIDALIEHQIRVTRIASTGGFWRRGNVTLLIGVQAEQVDEVLSLIEQNCAAPQAGEHKATIFVVAAENFVQVG